LVIVTAAVDNTGYGRETVPAGYPAVADPALTLALMKAAKRGDQVVHSGPVLTRDNFYRGVDVAFQVDYQIMSKANVQAVEMECAALFIVGALRKAQTAAILVVDGNVLSTGSEMMETYDPGHETVKKGVETALYIALETLTTDA
jgi:uridine phosphorylase